MGLKTREVKDELRASPSEQLTLIVCTSFDHYIYACAKDNTIYKLDTRKNSGPVCTFENDSLLCAERRTRLPLSSNKNFALVASQLNRVVVFDLNEEKRKSVLTHGLDLIDF